MHMVYLEKPVPDTLLSGVSGAVITVQNITDKIIVTPRRMLTVIRSILYHFCHRCSSAKSAPLLGRTPGPTHRERNTDKRALSLTIYAPVIYTAPCIMFWMGAYTLRGEVGGGWALEFPIFWAL
jgi:hypothetical protein